MVGSKHESGGMGEYKLETPLSSLLFKLSGIPGGPVVWRPPGIPLLVFVHNVISMGKLCKASILNNAKVIINTDRSGDNTVGQNVR